MRPVFTKTTMSFPSEIPFIDVAQIEPQKYANPSLHYAHQVMMLLEEERRNLKMTMKRLSNEMRRARDLVQKAQLEMEKEATSAKMSEVQSVWRHWAQEYERQTHIIKQCVQQNALHVVS